MIKFAAANGREPDGNAEKKSPRDMCRGGPSCSPSVSSGGGAADDLTEQFPLLALEPLHLQLLIGAKSVAAVDVKAKSGTAAEKGGSP
jgi:hypothetical protein